MPPPAGCSSSGILNFFDFEAAPGVVPPFLPFSATALVAPFSGSFATRTARRERHFGRRSHRQHQHADHARRCRGRAARLERLISDDPHREELRAAAVGVA
jgi:hypothetical protein